MIGIDSDAIIDFLKGKEEVVELVKKYSEELITTEINSFEVFFGVYRNKNIKDEEKNAATSFFSAIDVLPFTQGKKAAKLLADLYARGEALEQNDILIGQTFLSNGCSEIITNNSKHFSKIKGLKVINY